MRESKPVCGHSALTMHQLLRGTLSVPEAAQRLGVNRNRLAIYRRFVKQHCRTILQRNFAVLRELLAPKVWDRLVDEYFVRYPFDAFERNANAAQFPHFLWEARSQNGTGIGEFHVEIAELEWNEFVVFSAQVEVPKSGGASEPLVNPTLVALECVYPVAEFIRAWRASDLDKRPPIPAPAEGVVLVFRHPQSELACALQATDELLLAVKVLHERLDLDATAMEVGITKEQLKGFVQGAMELGVICR